ncbi:Hepatocyte growth factor-like protein [Seminavis robusta]|uniref:Hepatocyte growth factor-like protein n=1 Tax=Seminavis robusta TaxID=568900 RepID=A0A9N8H4I2_9STRA|nr:Hepatocyte growth factor-like protein [Seminavis robusta]|eukprot:Sro9_g007040.1 Hepatocyte growth factor-like protein (1136) ;mRNA; r:27322-31727
MKLFVSFIATLSLSVRCSDATGLRAGKEDLGAGTEGLEINMVWQSFASLDVEEGVEIETDSGAWADASANLNQHVRTGKAYSNSTIIRHLEAAAELCYVDTPNTCGSADKKQADYRGTISITVSKLPCQDWAAQEPQKHDKTPEKFPQSGLTKNYCRNPDGAEKAWCYTTNKDKRWEFCAVPTCGDLSDKCGVAEKKQADYRGTISVTESGIPCQDWAAQEPQKHDKTPEKFPQSGLTKNYCRNPDGADKSWCYTTKKDKRWEYCNVPACGKGKSCVEKAEGPGPGLLAVTLPDRPKPAPRPASLQLPLTTCNGGRKQIGLVPDALEKEFEEAGIPECVDAVASPLRLIHAIVAELLKQTGANEQLDDIVKVVFEQIERVAMFLAEQIGGFQAKMCVGDFPGATMRWPKKTDHMVPMCGKLPIATSKKAEWSAIAGHLTLPPAIAAQVCEGLGTSITFSFCLAASFCDVLPSVAFAMDTGLVSCIIAQGGVETYGIATIIAAAVQLGLNHVSFGLSTTNAFEMKIPLYNGVEFFDYIFRPTIYDELAFSIKSEKIREQFKDWFTLKATATRGLSLSLEDGRPADEKAVAKKMMSFNAAGEVDLAEFLNEFGLEIVIDGRLNFIMSFKNVPVIGKALPNFDIEVGRATVHITTAERHAVLADKSVKKIYPGISIFMGNSGNAQVIRRETLKVLRHFEGMVNLVLKKKGWKMDIDGILKHLNVKAIGTQHHHGWGVTLNEGNAGFILNVPIIVGLPITTFSLQCSSNYKTFGCKMGLDNVSEWFVAIMKEVKDGVMWVLHEADRHLNTLGEAFALSFEKAGEKLQDIFSTENMVGTFEKILEGEWNPEEEWTKIASVGYELLALCTGKECWKDGTLCVNAFDQKKLGTCCNCCNDETWWLGTDKKIPGKGCGVEPKWPDGTPCVAGISCGQCEHGYSSWLSVPKLGGLPGVACGDEPCWGDDTTCVLAISCHKCCNGHMSTKCGKKGCWSDGTKCLAGQTVGATCPNCCSGSNFWFGPAWDHCGVEPKWDDGTPCVDGISCHMCKHAHTWWMALKTTSLPGHACGAEPKWPDGTPCVHGISCHQCQNGDSDWMALKTTSLPGRACGKEPCWGDGTTCVNGISCHKCCGGHMFGKVSY